MKNLLLPLMAILLFASCKKQVSEKSTSLITSKKDDRIAARNENDKVDICHREGNGGMHTIRINVSEDILCAA